MACYLGIDQGGSKTHALIGDETGAVLGFGVADGACHATVGVAQAMSKIAEATQRALAQAGLARTDMAGVFSAMTGIDWKEEETQLKSELKKLFPHTPCNVANDCLAAMRAGTNAADRAVLCAGSGLNCAVRRRDGETYVYGYYIESAYQGGGALGRSALRAVFDAYAGLTSETALTERTQKSLGLESIDDMMKAYLAGRITPQHLHALALILMQTASEGDAVANRILHRFGYQWAEYVGKAIAKLAMKERPVEVVLSGSIFKPPYTAFAMPLGILICVGALEGLPKELEEAAFIDGANIYRIFFRIILPLLSPSLATVAILTFLSSWNELMLAVTFISDHAYKTITTGIMEMVGKYTTQWGLIGAGLVISTVPTLVVYMLLSQNVQKSLAAGAVKG